MHYIENYPLTGLYHTGLPIISLVAGGTGATQINPYSWLGQEDTVITAEKFKQSARYDFSIVDLHKVLSPDEQLAQIKQLMGLNILELAAILRVSRPTMYNWLESKKTTIRKEHRVRLNSIYEICKAWGARHLGRLGTHLHTPIGTASVSLFDLLKNESLSQNDIDRYFENIAQLILTKRQKDEADEALLSKHGFESVSKEDMADRLNDIDFLG